MLAEPGGEFAGPGEPPVCARHLEHCLVQVAQDPLGSGSGEGVHDIVHGILTALQPRRGGRHLPAPRRVLQEQAVLRDRFNCTCEAAGSHRVNTRVKLVVRIDEDVAPYDVHPTSDQLAYRQADLVARLDPQDDPGTAGRAGCAGAERVLRVNLDAV